jgi:conjugative transfer signal peptidase TraF
MTRSRFRRSFRRAFMIGLFKSRLRLFVRAFSRLSFVLVPVAVAAICMMIVWVSFGLVFNYTHSVPFGIYRGISDPVRTPHNPAPYVFFCPDVRWPSMQGQPNYRDPMRTCPDGFSPLIKPVVTWPGDTVKISVAGIAVNGQPIPNTTAISRDSKGHELHPFPAGIYRAQKDELWVVSSFSPRSFDSRYFGPIPLRSVRSWVRPLLVERSYHATGNTN